MQLPDEKRDIYKRCFEEGVHPDTGEVCGSERICYECFCKVRAGQTSFCSPFAVKRSSGPSFSWKLPREILFEVLARCASEAWASARDRWTRNRELEKGRCPTGWMCRADGGGSGEGACCQATIHEGQNTVHQAGCA